MPSQSPLGRNFLPPRDRAEQAQRDLQEQSKPFFQTNWQLRQGYWFVFVIQFLFLVGALVQLKDVGWLYPTLSSAAIVLSAVMWVPARKYKNPVAAGGSLMAVVIMFGAALCLLSLAS